MVNPRSGAARRDAGWWAVPGVTGRGRAPVDPAAEVGRLCTAFTEAAQTAPAGATVVALRELIDQLEAVWLCAAADFDDAGGPLDAGLTNLAGWLRAACRLAPGEAAAKARLARVLPEALPDTFDALRDGAISLRHAQVIESTVRSVPPEHRADAESALQEPARTLDPMTLKKVGDHLLHRLDADRADEQAVRRLERRGLTLSDTFGGMVSVSGLLDPVAGAALKTAVDSLVRPTRGNLEDTRSWAQRRADALTDICRQFLDSGTAPVAGRVRPHVLVLIDLATLRREPDCDGADLMGVSAITAEQARMIACDSGVSRVLLGGPGQVLDVGRTTRTVPPALRRALVARDRGCISRGCTARPEHCDAHHVVFWEDGGPTSLDNLALLCERHHTLVHTRGLRVHTQPDGRKTLHPPDRPPPPADSHSPP